MAMEETPEGGEAPAAPKKAKNKLVIIIIIAVLLVGLVAVGGYLAVSMLGGKKAAKGGGEHGAPAAEGEKAAGEAPPAGEHGGGGEGEAGGAGNMGVLVSLDPFIVNLASDAGKRYLKITMQLELARPGMAGEVTNKMPQIKDAVITVLSSKAADDLLTIEGKFRLKEQVLTRINNLLTSGVVKNIFFVEFVIQ